ncbi:MAG: hypothetical protein OCD01_10205 [Fibrobacterales bacterium]
MKELLKNAMLAGVGMAALTKEKIEQTVSELTKDFELSEEEGKKMLETLKQKAEDEGGKIKELVKSEFDQLKKGVESMNPSRLTDLEAKVAELQAEIEQLKKGS